ncbi:MAG: flippase-like domain-containing protein [Erysipelotrichaceae bacterium]|nr:flippase-like domain-containing protein [Erysipelotrichaceae bacterium]
MKEKIKKLFSSYAFNILSVFLFTALVLWLTLKDSFDDVVSVLRGLNPIWIIIIVLISILIQCVIGYGLTTLTKLSNPQYELSQGILNSFIGSFFCGVTPSSSGGQFAQVYIFKKQGVDFSDAASILWMEFIIYQATMVFIGLLLIILKFSYFTGPLKPILPLVLLGFAINSSIILGLWALGRFPKAYTFVSTKGINIAHKLRIVKDKEKTLESLDIQLKRFDRETKRLSEHKIVILKVVGVNIVRLILYYSLPFICAVSLNINVNLSMLVDVIALASFVSTINAFIPIPGSSGGTEITYVFMFSKLFGSIGARSTMIIWRVATFYIVMILGGLLFIYAKQKTNLFTKIEGDVL